MSTLRLAVRQIARQPGFSAIAVVTLALGLSVNATIFGLLYAFFLEPLAVRDPSRLVLVLQKSATWKMPHGQSWLDYRDYRSQVPEFADALATFLTPAHLSVAGHSPQRAWIEAASGNYFEVLGVPAALGRTFAAGEGEQPGADPVVVLSHRTWQTRFGSDPGIVGRPLTLNGRPFTVVGVMPPGFDGAQWSLAPAAWVPATMMAQLLEGGASLLENRAAPAFKVMARLRPGATLDGARASVSTVHARLVREYPDAHRESSILVMPEQRCRPEPTFSEFMPFAGALFLGLVLLVLLIACANVANLMFSRALARRREMGIRAALGASRGRLIRQLLTECVLLALLAGLLGSLLAAPLGRLIEQLNPGGDLPLRESHPWSGLVFVLTLGVSALAGMLSGLGPALNATRPDVQSVLKAGSSTVAGGHRHPLRSLLVVGQLALSLALLVCGGLFVDSLRRVARLDLGFRPDHLVMASLDLGLQGYDDARGRAFLERLVDEARTLPGVEGATVSRSVPFDYGILLREVGAEGRIAEGAPGAGGADGYVTAGFNPVDIHYLKTLGVPLVRGRHFESFDRAGTRAVAIINQTLARQLWGEEDPVGRRFRFGRGGDWLEVVGVARDGRYVMVGEEPRPFVYLPLSQQYQSPVTIHLRTTVDPLSLAPALRSLLARLDPDLPVYNLRTMDEHLRKSALALMPLRLTAALAGIQGALGLLLAMMGIYGVVAYVAQLRTREIGLRVALGAGRRDVLRLVVGEGWRLTLAGLGTGLVLALALAALLSRLLYGLSPFNLPVFGGVILLLAGVALLASYLPARRALRIDPLTALRSE